MIVDICNVRAALLNRAETLQDECRMLPAGCPEALDRLSDAGDYIRAAKLVGGLSQEEIEFREREAIASAAGSTS